MVETVNIPADRFSLITGFDRPGAVDTSKLTLGDPYIKFTASDGKEYYTRNFNHSNLLPTKLYLQTYDTYITNKTGSKFMMPIIEKTAVDKGILVGHVDGHLEADEKGRNKLHVNKVEISYNPKNKKITPYGATFASGKEGQGLKTNIGRSLLTQVVAKLPFIDDVGGFRISGAREVAAKERVKAGGTGETKSADARVGTNVINKIKQGLAKTGVIDGFFTQADITKEKVVDYLKKNNTAVAGVALSGNDPMQSLGVKGMGSPTDDAANYYLALAQGGFVDADVFGDMIDFIEVKASPQSNLMNIDQLTRPL